MNKKDKALVEFGKLQKETFNFGPFIRKKRKDKRSVHSYLTPEVAQTFKLKVKSKNETVSNIISKLIED